MPKSHRGVQTACMSYTPRIHPLQWAMAACAVATMLSAHFGAFSGYAILKPLTMVLALVCVATLGRPSARPMTRAWLMLGLLLSMVGDVCLLWDTRFVLGLAAFLCAHGAYLCMLRRDSARWMPSIPALLACATTGGALYVYLWTHGLPEGMRLPVLAYVWVIAAMAAQAIGRATVLRTRSAWYVGLGAISFMASDSILAFNQFVQPVPAAYLWVLGTYYLAQWLIVHGMLPTLRQRTA